MVVNNKDHVPDARRRGGDVEDDWIISSAVLL